MLEVILNVIGHLIEKKKKLTLSMKRSYGKGLKGEHVGDTQAPNRRDSVKPQGQGDTWK